MFEGQSIAANERPRKQDRHPSTREIAELRAILGSQAQAIEATTAMIVIPERPEARSARHAPGFWTRLKRVLTG